jgi:phosphoglycolate phosphatase
VFDLDGTLVDSRADIAVAANHVLARYGFAELTIDRISSFVGDGARWLMSRASGLTHDDSRLDALVDGFIAYYTAHPADSTHPLPHVVEALSALAALPLAVCTNKPRPTAEAVLDRLGLSARFDTLVAGGDLTTLKPDPLPLLTIARRLGKSPPQLVMVGDGPQDVLCGRRAGAFTVGVKGPMLPVAQLEDAHPDAMVETLLKLPEVLAGWGWQPPADHAVNVW